MTHDTSDMSTTLVTFGFGVVVGYMRTLFGLVRGGLDFIFQIKEFFEGNRRVIIRTYFRLTLVR